MSTGIKPKVVTRGRQFDEHAKRYVFYPFSNLDLTGSQFSSPVWNPKMPRGRIILLESFEYFFRGDDPDVEVTAVKAGQTPLIEKTMGTDAQVAFLMGNAQGSGWMERGMTFLESVTDLDPQSVAEIEQLILGDEMGEIEVPETLIDFEMLLSTRKFDGENPVADKARQVVAEMLTGVRQSIRYCGDMCIQLEKELREGQAGKLGIKALDGTQQYYFKQIRRPLPEDRAGQNMGDGIGKALAQFLQTQQAPSQPTEDVLAATVEAAELRKRLEEAERVNAEQAETIKTLAEAENES